MTKKQYLNYYALRLFFQDYRQFCEFCGKKITDDQTYSDLFYGTDSDIYVPLWASVAKTGEDVLLNHVTCDVIKFYKEYGYETVDMDGNPADFIGQQLRFAEYLTACGLKGSMDESEASRVVAKFEEQFLTDTIHTILLALKKYDAPDFIIFLLEKIISCDYFDWALELLPGDQTGEEKLLKKSDFYMWNKQPEIPVEEPKKISVASFCDCGSKCKMLATVSEGCLLSIEPDTDGTPLRFSGCPRGRAYGHTYLTSKRLRFPMERIAARGEGKFRRISWEDAVSKIAEATRLAKKEYGPGSRFVINAAGVSAAIRGDRFMKNLLSLDGGYLDYYNYYSAACAAYIAPYI